MKHTQYKIMAHPECTRGCPSILEDTSSDDIVVIGSLLSPEEETKMKKSAQVGVATHERTVRIPRAIFERAVDKYLTQKAKKR